MPHMTQPKPDDDPRLLAIAYVQFAVQNGDLECRKSRLLLEQDSRHVARAVGAFAFFLMDIAWLPAIHKVAWRTPWVEVDVRRRLDPVLRRELRRRERYHRIAMGWNVRPRRALRQAARDCVGMLWVAYQAECGPDAPVTCGTEGVMEMLHRYRQRFSHSSGSEKNA